MRFLFLTFYIFFIIIYIKKVKGENMELTRKQAEGLLISIDRYKAGKKYTVISGGMHRWIKLFWSNSYNLFPIFLTYNIKNKGDKIL